MEPEAHKAAFLLAGFHPVNKFSTKERAGVEDSGALGEQENGPEFSCTCVAATLNQREASDIS